ncbi:PqqD family peptide modification chaperone [Parerythrobacter jejuensis]|uniref:PqqD family peptide modification chaperone n=1 Tax=Parerythrobacter jejuensis TaxID=795812 RepID=A0A845AMI5_9SPHN|nr:PqqD family peptide modification chaperone [Parerythrobacter jejuensis]MXP32002.1 PqqD family peptide modification chaperone [Parerythrobacter jejuensis]
MADAPPLQLDSRLQRNPDLVATDMDGELVMMDIESGKYFGMDAVGKVVWEGLAQPSTARIIASLVRQAFSASDSDDVEADMLAFLGQLHANGLVTAEQ